MRAFHQAGHLILSACVLTVYAFCSGLFLTNLCQSETLHFLNTWLQMDCALKSICCGLYSPCQMILWWNSIGLTEVYCTWIANLLLHLAHKLWYIYGSGLSLIVIRWPKYHLMCVYMASVCPYSDWKKLGCKRLPVYLWFNFHFLLSNVQLICFTSSNPLERLSPRWSEHAMVSNSQLPWREVTRFPE